MDRRLDGNLLITGGFGYIGCHLVRALSSVAAGRIIAASRIPRLVPESVTAAVVDWGDPSAVAGLCRGVSTVIHLAAAPERDCARDPEHALSSNTLATLRLVEAAERAGCRRVIYLSTSKVFGSNPAGRVDEDTLPAPEGHYAITHRAAEDYVLARHRAGALDGVVLRLSNCFGAPAATTVDAWSVIANELCLEAAIHRRLTLRSSGRAWRNFVPISDVIRAIMHIVGLPSEAIGNGVFHVGAMSSMRIIELVEIIKRQAEDILSEIVQIQPPAAGSPTSPARLEWSIDKLMSTGWAPSADLCAEIDNTVRFCLKHFAKAS